MYIISGEGANVDRNSVEIWENTILKSILTEFDAADIFNADETGFFYKRLPKHTLAVRLETCQGTPQSKERLTVLVGANMIGSEKLPLLVIGKSQRPRSFRGANVPVKYVANSNAWMTKIFFLNWLQEWNAELTASNRKIALFLDNCSAHVFEEKDQFSNIKLVYFHPNSTSMSQPMDQGVIYSMKRHYDKIILRERIHSLDEGQSTYIPNILQGIQALVMAWNNVTQGTIYNCFRKANFSNHQNVDDIVEPEAIDEEVYQLMNQLDPDQQFEILDEKEQEMVDEVLSIEKIIDMFKNLNV